MPLYFIGVSEDIPEEEPPQREVNSWDDLVGPSERNLSQSLDEANRSLQKGNTCNRCPYLEKRGEGFYYCHAMAEEARSAGMVLRKEKPNQNSAELTAHLDSAELQLFCLGKRYRKCINFKS